MGQFKIGGARFVLVFEAADQPASGVVEPFFLERKPPPGQNIRGRVSFKNAAEGGFTDVHVVQQLRKFGVFPVSVDLI